MPPQDIAISVRGLSKCYSIAHNAQRHTTAGEALMHRLKHPFARPDTETFWALQDVAFDIHKGDVVGIIGRNGAGKSTLLKILSRIVEPTTGQIDLYGRVGSLLEVGTGFHPELTGRENVFLNGAILGMSKREIARQFDAIVDFSGTEQFLDTPVKRYSSGMYVRLAFAVAAHLNPEILIVDEVLAVGDVEFQKKCLGKMQDISRSGRTVLVVSHNMGMVTSLCERAMWIAQGRIRHFGVAREAVGLYLEEDAPSEAHLDVAGLPREEAFGNLLRLLRLEWLTGMPLRHGEDVCARIAFAAQEPVEGVAIGIGFCTPEGTRLLSYDTDFQTGDRRTLQAGKNAWAQLTIPCLPLAPGRYALDVGARSGDRFGLDYLPRCALVDVVPGARTPGSIIRPGAGVRLPCGWEWGKDAADDRLPMAAPHSGSG